MGFTWFPEIDWCPLYCACVIVQSVHNSSNNRPSYLITCHLKYFCVTNCDRHCEVFPINSSPPQPFSGKSILFCSHLGSLSWAHQWILHLETQQNTLWLTPLFRKQNTKNKVKLHQTYSLYQLWLVIRQIMGKPYGYLPLLLKVIVPTVCVSVILVMAFPFQ